MRGKAGRVRRRRLRPCANNGTGARATQGRRSAPTSPRHWPGACAASVRGRPPIGNRFRSARAVVPDRANPVRMRVRDHAGGYDFAFSELWRVGLLRKDLDPSSVRSTYLGSTDARMVWSPQARSNATSLEYCSGWVLQLVYLILVDTRTSHRTPSSTSSPLPSGTPSSSTGRIIPQFLTISCPDSNS